MIAAAILLAIYAAAWSRTGRTQRSNPVLAAAAGAALAMGTAFAPAVAQPASRSFTGHMIQHLLLLFVVPPLAVLARPLRVAQQALRHQTPPGRPGSLPLIAGWVAMVGVVVVSHVPSVYDTTSRGGPLHPVLHLTYLLIGLGFWFPIVRPVEVARRPDHGLRIIALLALPPVLALVAAAIGSAPAPMYRLADSIDDQRAGAALMWLGPAAVWMPALIWLVLDWAAASSIDDSPLRRSSSEYPLVVRNPTMGGP